MQALLRAALAAFLQTLEDKLKEKAMDEAKKLAEKLGLKLEQMTDEALADLAARKAELDKETRRAVRAFWIPVGLIVGGLAGFALAALTL